MARPRRRRLAFGLGASAAALLAAEGAARLAYRGRWPDPLVFDAEVGWAHRPGWRGEVRAGVEAWFDAHGLREGDRAVGPKQGRRVLLLGDSVAFGYGLGQEATIARALERRARAAGRPLEVLNAGVEGHATEQSTRLLVRLAPALRPDVAALVVCLRNDVGVPPLDPRAQARALAPAGAAARALVDGSALAYAVARLRHRRAVAAWRDDPAAGASEAFVTPAALAARPAPERAALLGVLAARLAAFRDAARAAGAAPLVALCPEADLLSGAAPREAVIDPLLAALRALDLPAVDLLPPLRAPGPPPLRAKDGVHPTAEGADRVAGALLEALEALAPR